ncbi:MAG: FemAB family XrtA/PEP-CTERM system-associated protein [Pseudomonadota bacterium]
MRNAPAALGALCIDLMAPGDAAAWDAYVTRHPDGTIFHRAGWAQAAQAAYGWDSPFLIARRGDEIVGGLPLTDVRSPLLGCSLISTAYCVGGGPIGDDAQIVDALAARALAMGVERNAQYIECRSNAIRNPAWITKMGTHATFGLDLFKDEEEALAAIPRKRRAEIRKALAHEDVGALSIDVANDSAAFYRLYARALRDHGTPVFPARFLSALIDAFRDETEISIARHDGRAVAALLSFYDDDTVRPYYIGAAREARSLRAGDLLYWRKMRRAVAKGCVRFDFGRSQIGEGPFHYKKSWGCAPEPVIYQCALINAKAAPNLNARNPAFSRLSSAWRRMPLGLANRLGPLIAGNFP